MNLFSATFSNKEDFFTVDEIISLVNDKNVQALKTYAESLNTPSGNKMRNKINTLEHINEIIINPMDIKDLNDFGKEIHYDPNKLEKANPSEFLDELWFSTSTDYPDTTQPVKVDHFRKSDFNKTAKLVLKNIKKDLLSGVSLSEASVRSEALLGICKGSTDPKLTIEAAKFVLWFVGDKDVAAGYLQDIAKTTWQDHPVVAVKASSVMVDFGENPQSRIDENAIILKNIAAAHWEKRPGFALEVALRVVKDCEKQELVEQGIDILKSLAVKHRGTDLSHSAAIHALNYTEREDVKQEMQELLNPGTKLLNEINKTIPVQQLRPKDGDQVHR